MFRVEIDAFSSVIWNNANSNVSQEYIILENFKLF